jgi:hypothetical protein
MIARPEIKAKVLTAGMGVRAPVGGRQLSGHPGILSRVDPGTEHSVQRGSAHTHSPLRTLGPPWVGKGSPSSPRKKQMASERLQSSMLGATLPRARPMWASRCSPGIRGILYVGRAGRGNRVCHGHYPSKAGKVLAMLKELPDLPKSGTDPTTISQPHSLLLRSGLKKCTVHS